MLASGSPRRRELLASAGLDFTVVVPAIDEHRRRGELPATYVARLAQEKAAAVQPRFPAVIIAADTSVVIGPRVLGKPANRLEAVRMLRLLSGRSHEVITGVCVQRTFEGASRHFVCRTTVQFKKLTEAEASWYAATSEPYDKAGGYAVQGIAGSFIRAVRGSYSNVVGLPVAEVLEALATLGFPLPWSGP